MTEGREVVITGTGLISPLGNTVSENYKNIKDKKTGIGYYADDAIPEFLRYKGKVRHVKLPEDIPHKLKGQMKFLNRGALLGFCSAHEAIFHLREQISDIPQNRRALYLASGDLTKIGYAFMYPAIKDSIHGDWQGLDYEKLNNSALNKINPFFLLESLPNNLFSFLSAVLEFMGPNTSLSSLSPCGSNALEIAYRSIQNNTADAALVVGYGSWITEIPHYELEGLGMLSQCRAGIHSFRPLERNRDGFIPGEGGAALVLEAADRAAQRKTKVLGKIKGFGNCIEISSDNDISVPQKISKRSLRSAMEEAGCDIDELAFIITHGNGTYLGDKSELLSIMDIFGPSIKNIPVCGLKSYTGHMGAASDIAEIIFGINALQERTVPATLNFHKADYEFSDLRISGVLQECEKHMFLSNSYGMIGQSSSVIIEAN